MSIYIMVVKEKASELEYAVNKRIKEGYTPNGGVAISEGMFHQTMIHTQRFVASMQHQSQDLPRV